MPPEPNTMDAPAATPDGVAAGTFLRTVLRSSATVALGLGGFLVIGLIWEAIASVTGEARLPAPSDVLSVIGDRWTDVPSLTFVTFESAGIGTALGYTVVNVLVGVLIGAVLGLPVGLLLARWRTFRLVFEPFLIFAGTVPLVIILPFMTLWFGTARLAQSGLVIVFTFLTVAFAADSAARTVGERYVGWALSLGASMARVLWDIILPAIGPDLIGALRLALASGWGLQVFAELLGSELGIGRLIQVTAQVTATTDLIAILLCVALTGLLVDTLVVLLGKLTVRWQE